MGTTRLTTAADIADGVIAAGDLASNSVTTVKITDANVTVAKLSTTLQKGYIPIDITSAREISSNDTQNLAAHGGILASDSTPTLARVNGATDKALRIAWVATNVDEIQFAPVAKPPDFDSSTDFTIHIWAAMSNTNDTPTMDIQVFDGVGDTECGGATGAISGTTAAEYSVIIANASIAAAPGMINISLVPAAHGSDALYLYAAWIEYQRT